MYRHSVRGAPLPELDVSVTLFTAVFEVHAFLPGLPFFSDLQHTVLRQSPIIAWVIE